MKRKHHLRHIKENYSYTVNEISEAFGVHKNTVHHWLKEGLRTVDSRKPFLIHGSDLKDFLQERQSAQKSKCRDDEMFCVKCQKPQKPFGNLVDVFMRTKNKANLQALCEVCSRKMNKGFKVQKFDSIKQIFDVGLVHNSHLLECESSAGNCDFI